MPNAIAEAPARTRDSSTHTSIPGVHRIQHLIANSYLVGDPASGHWVLVDAGICKSSAEKIISTAAKIFGESSKPEAILLTHGHFDHVGAVVTLARHWNVLVYAHPLEMPYVTGRSSYPPPDPSVGGGLMARMAPLYPRGPIQLLDHVRPLPPEGTVPGLAGWRWIHTPGHSPGHVAFFRESDRTLIAGDAFVTVQQESLLAVLTQRPEVHGPPMYYTPDWPAALESVSVLANLDPEYAATGHGTPMQGPALRDQLRTLVAEFDRLMLPARGRYLQYPARTDENGVVSVPPSIPNPLPKVLAAGLAAVIIATLLSRKQRKVSAG